MNNSFCLNALVELNSILHECRNNQICRPVPFLEIELILHAMDYLGNFSGSPIFPAMLC